MSAEITPAVERAERALVEAWHGTVGRAFHPARVNEARATLKAALPTECHESVPYEWADGDEGPCNSEHVVGYRLDEGQPYPVCADHMRPPMVPLRAALLGGAS